MGSRKSRDAHTLAETTWRKKPAAKQWAEERASTAHIYTLQSLSRSSSSSRWSKWNNYFLLQKYQNFTISSTELDKTLVRVLSSIVTDTSFYFTVPSIPFHLKPHFLKACCHSSLPLVCVPHSMPLSHLSSCSEQSPSSFPGLPSFCGECYVRCRSLVCCSSWRARM